MHGAPIFAALAAEASGVDLVYLALPMGHQDVARTYSLNFQVHPFAGDELAKKDIEPLLEMLATVDAAVIGPGLSRTPTALKLLRELIESAQCPLVLDASALQPWTLKAVAGRKAVLTPHLGELERMGLSLADIEKAATENDVTILAKGKTDRIAAPGKDVAEITGGNAGLTVGGTGDALAGLTAGLMAQGRTAVDACITASTVIKRAGTMLFHEYGYAYGTRRVIEKIPHLLHADPSLSATPAIR